MFRVKDVKRLSELAGEEDLPILPPERYIVEERRLKINPKTGRPYKGFEALEEAKEKYPEVLRDTIPHWEFSPTFRCPEDCEGCPDRASLHIGIPPEERIGLKEWRKRVDFAEKEGGRYILLIGGTIDNIPFLPKLMRYIHKKKVLDFGWFTDGIMLQDWRTGKPNELFERIVEEGNILEATTHVSADYLVVPQKNRSLPNPKFRWENSRWFKSAYGLNLARTLVEAHAKRVVINTAISSLNIDQVIPIYLYTCHLAEYAKAIGSPTVVLHTFSPWQHKTHLIRGDDPRNYPASVFLTEKHVPELEKISQFLLEDTFNRLRHGLPRVEAVSSGYIEALPEDGWKQEKRMEKEPGVRCFTPDGTLRLDPVMVSAEMVRLNKTSYGYTDRPLFENVEGKFENWWTKAIGEENKDYFLNLIQSTKTEYPYWR
mgnify:CR=1 FL=1